MVRNSTTILVIVILLQFIIVVVSLDVVHVVVPGFAQSSRLYQSLTRALPNSFIYNVQEKDLSSYSLDTIAHDLMKTARKEYTAISSLHLHGFSLGGRVSLATACLYEDTVTHLTLTGVGGQRTQQACNILQAWKSLLRENNLQGFAWNALLSSYSPEFLRQHNDQLESWVQATKETQDASLLYTLLNEAADDGEYSVTNMAKRLEDSKINVRLGVGQEDIIAPIETVQELANTFKSNEVKLFCSGHAVPIECRNEWQDWISEYV